MIIFNNKKYELFFSNNLPPLVALNYADELFFEEFENLCGKRYRILSIIRRGWQQKYGLLEDIQLLKEHFQSKIDDAAWPEKLLETYEVKSGELRNLLSTISKKEYQELEDQDLVKDVETVRNESAVLDAMSNMLHLFSSLVGDQFFKSLTKYSNDKARINKNFIFYTQPIKESRFAKIQMPDLKNRFELSKKDKTLSQILRVGTYVKDDVSELLDLRKKLMANLFKEISQRINSKPDDMEYLQISEIRDFLVDRKYPSRLIGKRKELTVLYYPQKKLEVYEGEEAESFIASGNLKEVVEKKDLKVLKGQSASLGEVMGVVKVAQNSDEAMQKMKKGNILVAPYTAVEYVPAMKKAAAIITETGGITSHAAIVSRELGIPCVIGVDDATKLLKDGQKVKIKAAEGLIELV